MDTSFSYIHRVQNEQIVGKCTKLPESHSGQHQHEYHLSLSGIQDPHEPGEKIAFAG